MKRLLSNSTLIPAGVVVVLLGWAFSAGMLWRGIVDQRKQLEAQQQTIGTQEKTIQRHDRRIIVLETKHGIQGR